MFPINPNWTRQEIEDKIKEEKIEIAYHEGNLQLLYEAWCKTNDDKLNFVEEVCNTHKKEGRKLVPITYNRTAVYWNQTFIDESTGDATNIERSMTITADGEFRNTYSEVYNSLSKYS